MAILKPTRVTTDEPASERLFMASAVIEILPVKEPTANFAAVSITFTAIPTKPESTP